MELGDKINAILKGVTESSAKIDALEGRIGVLESAPKVPAQAKSTEPERNTGFDAPEALEMSEEQIKKFRFTGVLKALFLEQRGADITAKKTWEGFEAEREIMMRQRELDRSKASAQASVDDSGGLFIPEVVSRELIDVLRSRLVLEALGVEFIDGIRADKYSINRQNSSTSMAWYSENEPPAESTFRFEKLTMEPKKGSIFSTLSNRLIKSADRSVEGLFRKDMIEVLKRGLEQAVLFGTGGVQPLGLITYLEGLAGTPQRNLLNQAATTGAQFDFDDAEAFRLLIEEADVPGDVAFLSRPTTWSLMKRLKVDHYSGQSANGNQAYLNHRPPPTDAMLSEWLGSRFVKSTAVPKTVVSTGVQSASGTASFVIAGVWRELVVGLWDRLRFRVSKEASFGNRSAFLQDETWIVTDIFADTLVRRDEAFVYAYDALQA